MINSLLLQNYVVLIYVLFPPIWEKWERGRRRKEQGGGGVGKGEEEEGARRRRNGKGGGGGRSKEEEEGKGGLNIYHGSVFFV